MPLNKETKPIHIHTHIDMLTPACIYILYLCAPRSRRAYRVRGTPLCFSSPTSSSNKLSYVQNVSLNNIDWYIIQWQSAGHSALIGRICWLKFYWRVRPPSPHQVSWVWHATTSDGEVSVLDIWRMWSILSLPLLLCPLWPRVVVPIRIPSMRQVELFSLLFGIIIISYLKPYYCAWIICII